MVQREGAARNNPPRERMEEMRGDARREGEGGEVGVVVFIYTAARRGKTPFLPPE